MSSEVIPDHLQGCASWLLESRFVHMPRQIQQIGRVGQMAHMAALRTQTPDTMERAARTIGNTAPLEESSAESVQTTLTDSYTRSITAALTADALQIRIMGQGSSTKTSNAIAAKAAAQHALHAANLVFHDYDEARRINQSYSVAAYELMQADHPSLGWIATKLINATLLVGDRLGLGKQFEGYEPLSGEETDQLRNQNNTLWTELRALQKYGIKPAIAPAISDSNIKNWLVQDIESAYGLSKHSDFVNQQVKDTFAVFRGSNVAFNSSTPEINSIRKVNNSVKLEAVRTEELFGENQTNFELNTVHLLKDGQLGLDAGLSLRKVAEELDALDAYEQLRSEILTIAYDLLTPVYIHDLTDDTSTTLSEMNNPNSARPEFVNKLRSLVLSRTRVLKELGEDIEFEMKKEIATDQENTTNRSNIAEHEVVNFIRKLPTGYKASQEARKQCMEDLGIELAETGETYVRKHTRGGRISEEKPKGHKAVFKQGKSKSKNRKKRR